jgi:hypothetical protein
MAADYRRSAAVSALRHEIVVVKQHWSVIGWVTKIYYLELLRASEGTLNRTNPHWARVVGYGLFSLCVIHKEGLCPSGGYINRLMMMIKHSI